MKKNKFITTILICILFLMLGKSFVYAQGIIDALQKNYQSLNSFSADFNQKLYHRESMHTQERSGTFSFEKEINIRFETLEPSEELLIVNSNEIWNYFPDEEIAYKYNAQIAKQSQNILSILTGKTALDKDFEVEIEENKEVDEEKFHFLKLYPLEPTIELTEAEIWIEPEQMLITRIKVYDFYGNTNEIFFSNYKKNIPLDTELFTFVPPNGIDIEDQSSSENLQIKGFSQ